MTLNEIIAYAKENGIDFDKEVLNTIRDEIGCVTATVTCHSSNGELFIENEDCDDFGATDMFSDDDDDDDFDDTELPDEDFEDNHSLEKVMATSLKKFIPLKAYKRERMLTIVFEKSVGDKDEDEYVDEVASMSESIYPDMDCDDFEFEGNKLSIYMA